MGAHPNPPQDAIRWDDVQGCINVAGDMDDLNGSEVVLNETRRGSTVRRERSFPFDGAL